MYTATCRKAVGCRLHIHPAAGDYDPDHSTPLTSGVVSRGVRLECGGAMIVQGLS